MILGSCYSWRLTDSAHPGREFNYYVLSKEIPDESACQRIHNRILVDCFPNLVQCLTSRPCSVVGFSKRIYDGDLCVDIHLTYGSPIGRTIEQAIPIISETMKKQEERVKAREQYASAHSLHGW